MPPVFLLSGASLFFSPLRSAMRLARETGFAGIEFSPARGSRRIDAKQLSSLADEAGLTVASAHPPTVPLPGWIDFAASFRRLALLARSLPGCKVVVMHVPPARNETDKSLQQFYRALEIVQEGLVGASVVVALENSNRHPGEPLGLFDDPAAWLALSQRHGCSITFDTAHASSLPYSLLEVYHTVRDRLANVHLSNVVSGSWWARFSYPRSILGHHRPPAQGMLPLPDLLAQLGRDGYAGLITLEISPIALHVWNRPRAAAILKQSLLDSRRWLAAGNSPAATR